jgi:hypothetical protein
MPSKLKQTNPKTPYETSGVAHLHRRRESINSKDEFMIIAHSNYAMRRILRKLGLYEKQQFLFRRPYYFTKVSIEPIPGFRPW